MSNIRQVVDGLREAIQAIVAKIKAVGVKISGSDQVRVSELANLIREIDLDVAKALIHVEDPAISITCEYDGGVSAEDRLYGSACRLSSRFANSLITSVNMHVRRVGLGFDTTSMFANTYALTEFTLVDVTASDNLPVINPAANMFSSSALTKADINARIQGSCDGMFSNCEKLKSVVLHEILPTSVRELFLNCENLESLSCDEGVLASSSEDMEESTFGYLVEDASNMFNGCSSLKYIAFGCKNLRCATGMFCGCSNLEHVHFSENSLTKTISCESMFEGCSRMTNLIFGDYALRKITNASKMFSGCSKMTKITVIGAAATAAAASYFEFGNSITDATDIFKGCSKLSIFPKLKIPVSYSIADLPIVVKANNVTYNHSPELYFILNNLPTVSTTQTLTVSSSVAQAYREGSKSGHYSQVKPSTIFSDKNWKIVDTDGEEVTDPE